MTEQLHIDRRASTRVAVDFAAIDASHALPLRARDLSLGGALLTDAERRTPGSVVDLHLSLPGEVDALRLRGVVAAYDQGTLHVRFVELRKWQMVKIAEALW